jgi:hypothetical protein
MNPNLGFNLFRQHIAQLDYDTLIHRISDVPGENVFAINC